MLDQVKVRLAARAPSLRGRIDGAAEFDRTVTGGGKPSARIAAFLIPTGIQGTAPDASAGAYTQTLRESLAVIVMFRTHSASAEGALNEIRETIFEVIEALCGWAPGDMPGVFQLLRAALLTFKSGTAFYQIDFTINDQLRITP